MQILVRLPDDLAVRFKTTIPARSRSAFIARLLARELPSESDELYRLALEVENDDALNADLADWDATVADGQDLGDSQERAADAAR